MRLLSHSLIAILCSLFALVQPSIAEDLRINCGYTRQNLVDANANTWLTDRYFVLGGMYYSSSVSRDVLYLRGTARYGLHTNFSYRIPVKPGSYDLNLHFAELEVSAPTQRVFHVVVNGNQVLTNFDILTEAPKFQPVVKTFPVNDQSGFISIEVIGTKRGGMLNGIEILSRSTGLPPATPVLDLSSILMEFSASVGGATPPAQAFEIRNTGGGTLSWTASKSSAWLSLSKDSGTGDATVNVTANPSGLAQGVHNGTIQVSAAGASGSPKVLNVKLTLSSSPPAPTLTVNPALLSFSAIEGAPAPAGQTVAVGSSSGTSLACSAAIVGTAPWLNLSATSGSTPADILVKTAAGLSKGNYSATISFTSPGVPAKTVGVAYTVHENTPPPTAGNEFFVTENGSPSGNGTLSKPWDLATALKHPLAVKPGDTIWVSSGTYTGGFVSQLRGTSGKPIVVRGRRGGKLPRLQAQFGVVLENRGADTWYWDLELMSTNTNRKDRGANGIVELGTRNKYINLVVHDTGQGLSFWDAAVDSEVYGSLVFHSGWTGELRGHAHNLYTQNKTGIKRFEENFFFKGHNNGIQIYGSGEAFGKGYRLDGNVSFENGYLYGGPGNKVHNIVVWVGSGAEDIVLDNTYTYHTPSTNDGYSRIGTPWSTREKDIIARGNYFIGGEFAIEASYWNKMTFSNNVIYSDNSFQVMMAVRGDQKPATAYGWSNNKYYGRNLFRYQGINRTFDAWKQATGLDATSTYTPGRPTGVWKFVRPNKYEPGRANIVIYNWDGLSHVPVDVSGVLKPGDAYEIRDVQNFLGDPVATGVYNGSAIPVPMSLTTVTQTVGTTRFAPVHTGLEFGAYVLLKK